MGVFATVQKFEYTPSYGEGYGRKGNSAIAVVDLARATVTVLPQATHVGQVRVARAASARNQWVTGRVWGGARVARLHSWMRTRSSSVSSSDPPAGSGTASTAPAES